MADHDHSEADVPATAAPVEMPPPSVTPDPYPNEGFSDAADDLLPPRLRGYQITGRLGRGGMGTVWRALQLSTRRAVAIKMLAPGMFGTRRARSRFDREVQLTAQLEHPDIARVYESGVAEGMYFYTMELVDGVPLDAHVAAHHLSRSDVLHLMRRICLAVQHAHQHGVIHRDLKPTNILVSADGTPKVLDFGLAKALRNGEPDTADDPPLSVDGAVSGTPGFMSPEQAAGRPVDTRSDVYSLGVILYRLLTSRDPHTGAPTNAGCSGNRDGNGDGANARAVTPVDNDSVIRPRTADHSIDRDLEALLLKALSPRPDGRYASAGELARDLGNYLSGDPLSAKRPTLTYFIRKRVRKYWLRATGVVLLLALVLGQAAWWSLRESQATRTQVATLLAHRGMTELLAGNIDRAALLGLAAAERRDIPQTHDLLRTVIEKWPGVRHLLHGPRDDVLAVASAFKGDLVAAAGGRDGDDYLIRLWDTTDGRLVARLKGHAAPVRALAIDRSGTLLASGDAKGNLRLWDLKTRTQIGDGYSVHSGPVYTLAFNRAGNKLASGGAGQPKDGSSSAPAEICVWDLGPVLARTGGPDLSFGGPLLARGAAPVRALAFSPDDMLLAAGNGEPAQLPGVDEFGVQLWALDGNARAAQFLGDKDGKPLRAVTALVSCRDHLVCGTEDGSIHTWRWPEAAAVAAAITTTAATDSTKFLEPQFAESTRSTGEASPVLALGTAQDGDRLTVAFASGSLKQVTGAIGGLHVDLLETVVTLQTPAGPVGAAAFADDGTGWIVSGRWADATRTNSNGLFVAHGVWPSSAAGGGQDVSPADLGALKRRVREIVNRELTPDEAAGYALKAE